MVADLAALAAVLQRTLQAERQRSARRRKRLRTLLIMLHHQREKNKRVHYSQINRAVPILKLYFDNPAASVKKELRINRDTVAHLLRMLSSPQQHGWGGEMELLVFLYSLAHGLSLSLVTAAFDIPKSTVHMIIHRVAQKFKAKLSTVVSLPTPEDLPVVASGFRDLSPAFERAAGAIGGTHFHLKAPGLLHQADYINHEQRPSIQMQAVCDATGRFLDVFVGYPGSVSDATVLRNSPVFTRAMYPPPGYYLLGDGGYPCLDEPIGLLTPYGRPERNRAQERFNAHHSRARSVIRRAFGTMKTRWRATLLKALAVRSTFVPDIVVCCAILHNVCLLTDDAPDEPPGGGAEDDPRMNQPVELSHKETTGNDIREQIAARLSTPAELPAVLLHHNYFEV